MRPDDYLQLLWQLDHPVPHWLPEPDLVETLHPHLPPDDPEWPAPGGTLGTSYPEVRRLLQRLRHPQQVICALTAVEMVLPVWDRWMVDAESVVPAAPRRALRQCMECVAGEVEWSLKLKETVLSARNHAAREDARGPALVASAIASAYSAANRELFLQSGMRSDQAPEALAAAAVDEAFQAWLADRVRDTRRRKAWETAPESMRDECPHRWWAHCRCRLAFRDAPRAPLV